MECFLTTTTTTKKTTIILVCIKLVTLLIWIILIYYSYILSSIISLCNRECITITTTMIIIITIIIIIFFVIVKDVCCVYTTIQTNKTEFSPLREVFSYQQVERATTTTHSVVLGDGGSLLDLSECVWVCARAHTCVCMFVWARVRLTVTVCFFRIGKNGLSLWESIHLFFVCKNWPGPVWNGHVAWLQERLRCQGGCRWVGWPPSVPTLSKWTQYTRILDPCQRRGKKRLNGENSYHSPFKKHVRYMFCFLFCRKCIPL